MRKSDRPIEALDAKGSCKRISERADHNEIERRASLEKPNVPVEIVGANRRLLYRINPYEGSPISANIALNLFFSRALSVWT